MEKYSYRVRKNDYYNVWYAEKLEWGVVVVRYDFPTEQEAREAISDWQNHQKSRVHSGE